MSNSSLGQRVSDKWWPGNNKDDLDVKAGLAELIDAEAAKQTQQPVDCRELLIEVLDTVGGCHDCFELSAPNDLKKRVANYIASPKRESVDARALIASVNRFLNAMTAFASNGEPPYYAEYQQSELLMLAELGKAEKALSKIEGGKS